MIAFPIRRVAEWVSAERRRPQLVTTECSGTTSAHDNANVGRYLVVTHEQVVRVVVLCDGCRRVYAQMGLSLNPDRRA